jgi:hypothetical protein
VNACLFVSWNIYSRGGYSRIPLRVWPVTSQASDSYGLQLEIQAASVPAPTSGRCPAWRGLRGLRAEPVGERVALEHHRVLHRDLAAECLDPVKALPGHGLAMV